MTTADVFATCHSVVTCCPPLLNLQFESEFRRFNVDRTKMTRFDAFSDMVRGFFRLTPDMHITMSYTDPRNSDLLPINNDDNLQRAFSTAMPLLKVFIYREQGGWCHQADVGVGGCQRADVGVGGLRTNIVFSLNCPCFPFLGCEQHLRLYVRTYLSQGGCALARTVAMGGVK